MTGFDSDKQYLLDLLVDGELSDDERRELLAWCERQPDGWRRCALAFLEAQNWSQVLGDLTEKVAQPVIAQIELQNNAAVNRGALKKQNASPVARPQSYWQIRQWGSMLAMAASVALAFTLGLWVRDAGKAGRIVPDDRAAVRVVEGNQGPVRVPTGRPEQGPVDSVRLIGGRWGAADEIQLPVMASDELDGDWLLAQPAAMPDEVRQALERMGHRVEQRRQLVPYRLDDGRKLVVPVDQVEVRPVDNRSYQ
jgi:hypothetical protein